MPYSEEETIMISGLQHYLFCPRQCALIHIESLWTENYLTAAGRLMHEKVDSGGKESRGAVLQAASLRLFSREYGLYGVADMVEFIRTDRAEDETGRRIAGRLSGRSGWWRPHPVEYKHGRPLTEFADSVQLCAQALCLEEMLQVTIETGDIFYGTPRRRFEVHFDAELREKTRQAADGIRELFRSGTTPPAVRQKHCEACSMLEYCEPHFSGSGRVKSWLNKEIDRALL